MANTTSNWSTWKSEIDLWIDTEMNKNYVTKPMYGEIFGVSESSKLINYVQNYSGFTPMVETGELEDAVDDNPIQGYGFAYVRKYYRKSTTFSVSLIETDQSDKVKQIANGFPGTIMYSRNLKIFSMFRRAWDTGLTYGTGKPLASVAIPYKNGSGTYSNTFVDGVQRPLSYDAVNRLTDESLYTVNSDAGNMLMNGAEGQKKILFGSYALREKLYQIGKVEGKPGTNENDMNYIVKGDAYDVMVLPFVSHQAAVAAGETTIARTSTSNFYDSIWGVLDPVLAKQNMKVFFSTGYSKGKFDDEILKSNQALVKYCYDSYAFGLSDHRHMAISKGNGSTVTT